MNFNAPRWRCGGMALKSVVGRGRISPPSLNPGHRQGASLQVLIMPGIGSRRISRPRTQHGVSR